MYADLCKALADVLAPLDSANVIIQCALLLFIIGGYLISQNKQRFSIIYSTSARYHCLLFTVNDGGSMVHSKNSSVAWPF